MRKSRNYPNGYQNGYLDSEPADYVKNILPK